MLIHFKNGLILDQGKIWGIAHTHVERGKALSPLAQESAIFNVAISLYVIVP